jgi:hypothetical protein
LKYLLQFGENKSHHQVLIEQLLTTRKKNNTFMMAPSATTETPATGMAQEHKSGDPSLAFVRDEQTLPPTFKNKLEEQKFLKHRLALAYRVFAKSGFADGVAGHITVRFVLLC